MQKLAVAYMVYTCLFALHIHHFPCMVLTKAIRHLTKNLLTGASAVCRWVLSWQEDPVSYLTQTQPSRFWWLPSSSLSTMMAKCSCCQWRCLPCTVTRDMSCLCCICVFTWECVCLMVSRVMLQHGATRSYQFLYAYALAHMMH